MREENRQWIPNHELQKLGNNGARNILVENVLKGHFLELFKAKNDIKMSLSVASRTQQRRELISAPLIFLPRVYLN